jgi:lipoate-protein ligase B
MLDFDTAVQLQRSLVYQLGDERDAGAIILCEHPRLITVGRHGNPADLRAGREELASQGWMVRWVSRGGGTYLHLPGQLAIYPVIPLAQRSLAVGQYIEQLERVLISLLGDFGIVAQSRADKIGVWVGSRLIAAVGVAVRQQITTFGAWLNIDPDLTLFRLVNSDGGEGKMTSIVRERRGPLRTALVRQRLLEHFRDCFGFEHADVFFPSSANSQHQRIPAQS